jgi:hypothetical protein
LKPQAWLKTTSGTTEFFSDMLLTCTCEYCLGEWDGRTYVGDHLHSWHQHESHTNCLTPYLRMLTPKLPVLEGSAFLSFL